MTQDHPGARLVGLLAGARERLVDAAVAQLARDGYADFRPVQHETMQAVDAGARTASALGRSLGVTKQSALRTVSVLVAKGWLERDGDPSDGRRMSLRVTQEGRRASEAGARVFDALRRSWEDEIGDERLADVEAVLTRLASESPPRGPGDVSPGPPAGTR